MKRQNLSIKKLAALLESQTGHRTSEQELTRRLSRNDFQEQDMRELARALNCSFSIQMQPLTESPQTYPQPSVSESDPCEDIMPSVSSILAAASIPSQAPTKEDLSAQMSEILTPYMHLERRKRPGRNNDPFSFSQKPVSEPSAVEQPEEKPPAPAAFSVTGKPVTFVAVPQEPALPSDCINPLTGTEYLTNTVRRLENDPGYIEVYDQSDHSWTRTNESELNRFQQQKRGMMGRDYEPPIYI